MQVIPIALVIAVYVLGLSELVDRHFVVCYHQEFTPASLRSKDLPCQDIHSYCAYIALPNCIFSPEEDLKQKTRNQPKQSCSVCAIVNFVVTQSVDLCRTVIATEGLGFRETSER